MVRRLDHRFAGFLSVIILIAALIFPVARASATVYIFEQTAASVPGLQISSSISINGQINNLPNVNSLTSPINLGNLLSFTLTGPVGTFTLSDFTSACESGPCFIGYPDWSISPGGISFIDAQDATDFFIRGFANNSIIQVDSDGFSSLSQCNFTGACKATGDWVPIPEPPMFSIFMTALALLALKRFSLR